MDNSSKTQTTTCPYCHESYIILETVGNLDITIVCPHCRNHFCIHLPSFRTTKKKLKQKAFQTNDDDTELLLKLRCAYGCSYYIYYKNVTDEIISVICPKCGKVFRANLESGRTWASKARPSH